MIKIAILSLALSLPPVQKKPRCLKYLDRKIERRLTQIA
tara:strand:- start:392 stop:508 length:117 start_codon:yes stop_codon:yes gene_type:complete